MGKENFLVEKIIDKIKVYDKTGCDFHTMFLEPNEICKILKAINGYDYTLFGGYDDAERKMLFVGHVGDFNDVMCVLEIKANSSLNHRSVLGSLIGLGIKREVVGDILILENVANVIIEKEISKFVLSNLEKVGREKVICHILNISELVVPVVERKEVNLTVASNRLDAIISAGFGISRDDSASLISTQRVSINHEAVMSNSKKVSMGDLISVRGHGRLEIVLFEGITKRGRLKISIIKY